MTKKVMSAFAVASAALLGLAMPASAEARANPDCQNDNGFQTVVRTGPVENNDGDRVGTVMLCREGSLYFGFVLYRQPMTASQYALAYLDRYDNGAWVGFVSCDDPGGNGYVKPGQTRCWTANLNGAAARYTFKASSTQISSHTNTTIAEGGTERAR